MTFFNQYSLSVMGIMFEIIGSFILTIEAFGSKWMEKPLKKFIQFSNWTGKSFIASISIVIIVLIPFTAAAFFGNKTCGALLLPFMIFVLLFTQIFDEPEKFEKWTLLSYNNKKIGPFGFILLLIGNGLQLISTIIQI
ncbi:hypothetical protein [Flavobacterium sp.]|uniref:hypothetical protein n=1 Tax=Flavobacterium sp. TaxID=239 RepID=UPI0025C68C6B|nr:hypothetical protein [Flavobacterium sp.]